MFTDEVPLPVFAFEWPCEVQRSVGNKTRVREILASSEGYPPESLGDCRWDRMYPGVSLDVVGGCLWSRFTVRWVARPHVLESSRHLPDMLETPPRCWNGKGEYIAGD
jgi:hypothetical protein